MKRTSIVFLQIVVVLFGIGILALMLWEPHLEGVNAHATTFEIYFKDPFLVYIYATSIPFFAALYQAFKLLGYIGQDEAMSADSLRAVRILKRCAMSLIVLITAAVVYLSIAMHGKDEGPGGAVVGAFLAFASAVVAASAAVGEGVLQKALDIKSGKG